MRNIKMSSILAHPLLLLLLLMISCFLPLRCYPSNEYEYSFSRDMLMDAERKFERRNELLSTKEQTVDHYLQYLKWREFTATRDSGFPPSRPIEEVLNHILETEIYRALVKFPKGGNMHSHEKQALSKRVLLDIVWDSPDYQYLYILPPNHPTSPWMLDFFVNPPSDNPPWINVKNNSQLYRKEEILKQQTLLGIMTNNVTKYPTDSDIRWKEINKLWGRTTSLINNMAIRMKYVRAIYEEGLREGVIYFETRKNLHEPIYVLDLSPEYNATNGKRYLNPNGDYEIDLVIKLAGNFSAEHPEFVGHKRISTVKRFGSITKFDVYMKNVVRLRQIYPNHVLGLDALGEEDAGYSILYFLNELLQLYNSTTNQTLLPLYLHTAETNWPDDLMASALGGDLVSSLMNSYEAVLLNSRRLGHGYGFIKHPYLLSVLKEKQVPIEICVVSNQMLGFSPDIRNHPAQHFMRYGIPVMLGADDAGTFGYDNFTVDWYEAFMAWGLDLHDLRTLAVNSLNYSGLNEAEKKDAIDNKWRPMWNKYIDDTYTVTCSRDYAAEASRENRSVTFAGILPKEGAKIGSTKVHVFGRNFEIGICKNVSCRFGDRLSPSAAYASNQHIICQSPDYADDTIRTVQVFVSLDGANFTSTGFNFTYEYNAMSTMTASSATAAAAASSSAHFVSGPTTTGSSKAFALRVDHPPPPLFALSLFLLFTLL